VYKPASNTDIEAANNVVFFFGETTMFEIRAKIV